MKTWKIVLPLLLVFLTGCLPNSPEVTDYEENFEALWRIIDERYCFLDEKPIDWDVVHTEYAKVVKSGKLDDYTFFSLMSSMLNLLKDGHVNLIAPFNTSRYGVWEGEDPTKGLNIYARNQALGGGGNLMISGGMAYGVFNTKSDSVRFGYIQYGSFSSTLGNMRLILNYFNALQMEGIILDLRGNGGGSLQNANDLLTYFFKEKTLVGYTSHKLGPGRGHFSEPRALYVVPDEKVTWTEKPLIIIQDRGCYSATNDFLYKIVLADNVTTIGIKSGGGAGLPATQELPNGWRVRYSAVKNYDHNKKYVEDGIEPDIKVQNQGYLQNPSARDVILYSAVDELRRQVRPNINSDNHGE